MKSGQQLIFPVCDPNGKICVNWWITFILGQEGSDAGLKFLADHYLPFSILDCQVFDSGASVEVLVGGLSRGRRSVLRLLQVQVLKLLLLSVQLGMRLLLYLSSFFYYGLRLGRRDYLSLGSSWLKLVIQGIGHVDFIICIWLMIRRGLRRPFIFLVVWEDDDLARLLLELLAQCHCHALPL